MNKARKKGEVKKEKGLGNARVGAISYAANLFAKTVLVLLTSYFSLLPCRAADFQVAAQLDRPQIALNEQAVLTLTISGASTDLPQPQLPGLVDFQVTNAGEAQNFEWINGKASASVTYRYVLTALKEGHLTIPPIHVAYKGQTIDTEPLALDVTKGDAGAIPAQAVDHPSAPQPAESRRSNALFITATVNKSSVYVGEPVTFSFRLYNRVPLLRAPTYDPPTMSGFWSEDLPPQRSYQATEKGVPYNVTEVMTALFPTAAGHAHIGAAGLHVALESVGTDPFSNDFFANFFGRAEEKVLHTDPIVVHVKALPEPKPAGFKGAVGHYTLTSNLDKESTSVGQPITLTLTVTGRGNIKSLPEIPLPTLTNFRTFDANASTNIDKKDYHVQGSKSYKTVLIPAASGDLQIPSVSFIYFDPDSASYQTLRSRALVVHVTAAGTSPASTPTMPVPAAAGSSYVAPVAAPGVQMLSDDIRYIKTPASLFPQGRPLVFRPIYLMFNGIIFLLISAGALGRLYQKLFLSNTALTRFKNAKVMADADTKRAEAAADRSDVKGSSSLLSDALHHYVNAKLGSPQGVLSLRDALEALKARGLNSHSAEKLRNLWETLDLFQFAPTQVRPDELQKTVRTLQHVIEEIESAIQWK